MKSLRQAAATFTALGIAFASGEALAGPGGAQFTFGDWHVHTAVVDLNEKTGLFSVPGHILLTRPTGDINADKASGNFKQKQTTLAGHVVVHDSQGGAFANFGTGQEPNGVPSTLTTDQLEIDSLSKMYVATGNVHYTQGARTIEAQKGTLDDNTKDLTLINLHFVQGTQTVESTQGVLNDRTHILDLTGKVHIVDADRKMDADHVVYNTQSGHMHARGNVNMSFPGGQEPAAPGPPAKKKKKKLIPF
ncbi:MAG: hypothetical protein NVS1B14_09850 [Vulcanimicrobiaceae bacterium]